MRPHAFRSTACAGSQLEGLATKAELDQAQGEHDVAEADLAAAKAQITQLRAALSSARTTLAYTRIYSPIDGIVINRAIDPGQTVAASFSAPVLFVIAQDLAKMQVMADIDEADVGKLREQMPARSRGGRVSGRKIRRKSHADPLQPQQRARRGHLFGGGRRRQSGAQTASGDDRDRDDPHP